MKVFKPRSLLYTGMGAVTIFLAISESEWLKVSYIYGPNFLMFITIKNIQKTLNRFTLTESNIRGLCEK